MIDSRFQPGDAIRSDTFNDKIFLVVKVEPIKGPRGKRYIRYELLNGSKISCLLEKDLAIFKFYKDPQQ